MATVEMLSEDERSTSQPAWATTAEAIHRVVVGRSMAALLEGSRDAWLSLSHAAGYGVQVTAMEDGELGEKVLINPPAAVTMVAVTVAGLPQEEPLRTLVPETLALAACKHFWETGRRSQELVWQDPYEAEREATQGG